LETLLPIAKDKICEGKIAGPYFIANRQTGLLGLKTLFFKGFLISSLPARTLFDGYLMAGRILELNPYKTS
jgi:hypothetical protein